MKQVFLSFLLLSLAMLAGCQSAPSIPVERSIASTSLLRVFITEVADQSKTYGSRELQRRIEANLKTFLRQQPLDGSHGNWARMGITREQAMRINGLYDDLPYMNKVQKWVMENITVLAKEIKPSVARQAYAKITGRSGALFDPYFALSDDVQNLAIARRNQTMPDSLRRSTPEPGPMSVADEIQSRNTRLIAAAEKLEGVDAATKNNLIANLRNTDGLAARNPLAASNIHHSMEGSLVVAKKTGARSIGKGCKSFTETASGEILEIKARVDMRRAELVEARAYEKAGGPFDSVQDIPASRRLTQAEVDELTEQAFTDTLGYSKREAQAAVKRLKTPPCQVY